MARLHLALTAFVVALLLAAVPAALGDPGDGASIEERIAALREQVEAATARERVLTGDLAAAGERLDATAGEIAAAAVRVSQLEEELERNRRRLAELRRRLALETRRLATLQEAEKVAQDRLARRVVELYVNDLPDELEIIFQIRSLNDLISQLDYLDQIARRDLEISEQVAAARARTAESLRRIDATVEAQAETTALLAERTREQREQRDRLVAYQAELASAQADRRTLLATVRNERHEAEEDLAELERAGARLAEQLRASTVAAALPVPSSSGFVWPVDGPITSGFGMRWGRLHAGVDIGVGFGTPIRAAAAGVVGYAGWLGGYGNLVVVEHGGGLATAYAHQQRIDVSVGTTVSQGATLGEVGSTGNSTGPHLHFEVRVNGTAVDPLAYL